MKKRKWLFDFIWQYNSFFIAKTNEYSLLKITFKYSGRYSDTKDESEILGISFYFVILGIGFIMSRKIGKW